MNKVLSLSMFGLLLLFFADSANGQSMGSRSLRGINAVQLVVEQIDSEGSQYVSEADVQRVIRQGLTSRGITVTEQTGSGDRFNYLYLNINLLKDERGIYFNMHLSFNQMVTLRNGDEIIAATWDTSMISKGPPSTGRNQILNAVESLVDKFLIDYFAGNR